MYKNVIPMVQGLAYQPEQNPLQTISQAYGMWNGAMQYDPTGSLMTAALRNAFLTGAIGAGVGQDLPSKRVQSGVPYSAWFRPCSTAPLHLPEKDNDLWYSNRDEGTVV